MIDAMNEQIVKAMYETLPCEITVIDAHDKVIGWNKHHNRLFYRPQECMEMDFRKLQVCQETCLRHARR
jgi:DUF438 domain-containing protein